MSTRDRLLELANTLIQKNGFEGFSYADLAREMGIRKASIHHHFPAKADLGLAYCETKRDAFSALDAQIQALPPGPEQLRAYLEAFSGCAREGQMCGVYAMLSDSNLFPPELQTAVSDLAVHELRILAAILQRGREAGLLAFGTSADDMAVIVCNALKGALLLNRTPPHDACERTVQALMQLLSTS
ncbi:TetR/AcrR family transcriptional regulator [Klebsiella aerogenes]|uniref:TetR/AcrR family transcriptional regulator n=1 Tax=Klebsiella aerogenes TaxID=548 RepID=UPI002E3210EB|nr:TetR/AcrR family transcriptional regulator [Klebsiella aerogenes]MED7793188.1 TetR/AcrR family transcriptional regulator [Klebsiella aerogenes]